MKPAMYVFVNSALGMTPGKIAAQAAHAAVEAYRKFAQTGATPPDLVEAWLRDGHYAKYVMDGGDSIRMLSIDRYLRERDFNTALIIDEGHTEDTYFVPTALGTEIVDKDDERTAAIFGEFRTLRPPQPQQAPTREIYRAPAWMHFRRKGRGGR